MGLAESIRQQIAHLYRARSGQRAGHCWDIDGRRRLGPDRRIGGLPGDLLYSIDSTLGFIFPLVAGPEGARKVSAWEIVAGLFGVGRGHGAHPSLQRFSASQMRCVLPMEQPPTSKQSRRKPMSRARRFMVIPTYWPPFAPTPANGPSMLPLTAGLPASSRPCAASSPLKTQRFDNCGTRSANGTKPLPGCTGKSHGSPTSSPSTGQCLGGRRERSGRGPVVRPPATLFTGDKTSFDEDFHVVRDRRL